MNLCFTIAVVATLSATTAFAQANNFQMVSKSGRNVGHSTYTIDKTKDGFKVRTKFEYKLSAPVASEVGDPDKAGSGGLITEAQMTGEYKIALDGNFLSGFTQNSTTQMMTSLTPSRPRDLIIIGQIQGGVNLGSKSLPLPKPDFFLTPDFDPAAMQVLLTAALNHPHADHIYLTVIPSNGASAAKGGSNSAYMTVADSTDATGTLDGKPVALKHYALTWNKSKGDFWADADGNLMQANIGPLNAKYIRVRFVLSEDAEK